MRLDDLKESKYLKRADIGAGKLMTMKDLRHENMAMEGEPVEMKYVLYFAESAKGLALNTTNAQLIMQALGVEDTDDWMGKQIVLFDDPSIMYKGHLTGGIRCRAPRGRAAVQPTVAQRQAPPLTMAPAVIRQSAQPEPAPVDDGVARDDDLGF